MKQYLLLRDNRESGPYSEEEISRKGLYPTDLVWLEGQSSSWAHPDAFRELQQYITATPKKAPVMTRRAPAPAEAPADLYHYSFIFRERGQSPGRAPHPASGSPETGTLREFKAPVVMDTASRSVRKDDYTLWNRDRQAAKKAFGLVAVFMAVIFSAFVIKKIVDQSDVPEPAAGHTLSTGTVSQLRR